MRPNALSLTFRAHVGYFRRVSSIGDRTGSFLVKLIFQDPRTDLRVIMVEGLICSDIRVWVIFVRAPRYRDLRARIMVEALNCRDLSMRITAWIVLENVRSRVGVLKSICGHAVVRSDNISKAIWKREKSAQDENSLEIRVVSNKPTFGSLLCRYHSAFITVDQPQTQSIH